MIDTLTTTTNTITTSATNLTNWNNITNQGQLLTTDSYSNWTWATDRTTTALPSNLYPYEKYIWSYWGHDFTKEEIEKMMEEKINEKENKNKMANVFGPYSNQNLRLSPYGIAIKNKNGKWVSYDKETNRLIDVDIFNIEIDSSKLFYRLPKALKEIEPGYLILHNGELVFVEKIDGARIDVINPVAGTAMTILPANSPFGYDYIDTIISLTDYLPKADEENPWGSLLPFMMLKDDQSILAMILALGGDLQGIDPMMLLAASGYNAFAMFVLMNQQEKTKKAPKPFKRFNSHREDIDE